MVSRWTVALDCYVGWWFFRDKLQHGSLLVFSVDAGRILLGSLVSWKASWFPTCFWMQQIIMSVQTDSNARNFSIRPSIISYNTNDFFFFFERERELGISHRSLLMLTRLFDLEYQNFLTAQVDGRIYSSSLKHTLCPQGWHLRRSNNLWPFIWDISPYYHKSFASIFRRSGINFNGWPLFCLEFFIYFAFCLWTDQLFIYFYLIHFDLTGSSFIYSFI